MQEEYHLIQISLPWIIEVGAALDAANDISAGKSLSDSLYILLGINSKIEAVFDQSIYGPNLRTSRQKATELHKEIESILGDFNLEKTLTDFEVWALKNKRDQFKIVFMAELGVLPSFVVTQKEGFDTAILIESGISLFPKNLLTKAPETARDAAEAGRALAFELATACGFHCFRVTESVVRRYWDEVSGGAKRPKPATLGSIADALLNKNIGETKINESIRQMTRLHRNPLIHPEVILSIDEAIGLVGIARSVIGAMLTVLPDVPITTGVPTSPETGT